MKRGMDVILAAGLIVLLSPILLVVAAAILCTSNDGVLYWSRRIGRGNRPFSMPKFRTMRVDTPQVATHLLTDSRQWLTPMGSFLRSTSLDELPQLWSILCGDMSFVGPRPALYNQYDLVQLRTESGVHHLPPGLTGWAQVNGRDELTNVEKVDYDRQYAERQTTAFDAYILAATVLKVARRDGVLLAPRS